MRRVLQATDDRLICWSYRLQASHRLARTIRTHRRRHAAATGRAVCMIYLSTYNVAFSGSVVTDGDEDLGYSRAEDHTDEYSKSKIIAERAVLSANGAIPPRYRAEMCCRDLNVVRRARRRGHDRAPPGCDLRRARESPSATYHAAHGVGDVRGGHRRQGRLAGIRCPSDRIYSHRLNRDRLTSSLLPTGLGARGKFGRRHRLRRARCGRPPAPSAAGRTSSTTASR